MADVVGLKSIRRIDLSSRSPSSEPNDSTRALEAELYEQLRQTYAEETNTPNVTSEVEPEATYDPSIEACVDGDADAYDFRLFARPTNAGAATIEAHGLQRITLRSPTPTNAEPGFIQPRRPEEYYLTGVTSAEHAAQFRQAAVSGELILEGLKQRWPGFALPWRVTVLQSPASRRSTQPMALSKGTNEKRKRNGKKKRIIIRKRFEAKAASKAAALMSQVEKAAAEKEKRTRKNREKKVKKRQKEKLKKSQGLQEPD